MYPEDVDCQRCDSKMKIRIFFYAQPSVFWCPVCNLQILPGDVELWKQNGLAWGMEYLWWSEEMIPELWEGVA